MDLIGFKYSKVRYSLYRSAAQCAQVVFILKWCDRRQMADSDRVQIKACYSRESCDVNCRCCIVVRGTKRVLWISPGGSREPVGTEHGVVLHSEAKKAQHTSLSVTRWSSAVSRNLKHFLQRLHSESTWKWEGRRGERSVFRYRWSSPLSCSLSGGSVPLQ